MAFLPKNCEYPMLKSLRLLQKSKGKRSISNQRYFKNQPINASISKKIYPIHMRKISDYSSPESRKSSKTYNSSYRIAFKGSNTRFSSKLCAYNDSVGVSFRTFALASNRNKTSKRSANSSLSSEKKIFKITISMQTPPEPSNLIEGMLSPWH